MKPALRDVLRRCLHRHERGEDAEQADGSGVVSTLAATLPVNRGAIETVTMPRQRYSAPIDFYHSEHMVISECACAGLACFAARANRPDRRQTAATQTPVLYCLGKYYDAPSDDAHDVRPHVDKHAYQTVLLGDMLCGGVRDLPTYRHGGAVLEKARQVASQALLNMMEASRLQGRGGAVFPMGIKWQAVTGVCAETKYVVVNVDESDPGAFSDRFLLEDDPFRLIEATATAAHAISAQRGYIYIRKEYPDTVWAMSHALEQARVAGWLGPTLELGPVVGQGVYICGEETSLLNALEDRHPEVQPRSPQISERGLLSAPTLVHNVETLCAIPWVVTHGAAAYAAPGFSNSRGTKLLSLNSLFCRLRLYEVESGISLADVVEQFGQRLRRGKLNGLTVGSPLAGIVPPILFDIWLGYEEIQAIDYAMGHGGVIAFADGMSIPRIVAQVLRLGAHESCGKCMSCHLGTPTLAAMVDAVANRLPVDAGRFRRLIDVLAVTNLCGRGRGLTEFVQSVHRHYPPEL